MHHATPIKKDKPKSSSLPEILYSANPHDTQTLNSTPHTKTPSLWKPIAAKTPPSTSKHLPPQDFSCVQNSSNLPSLHTNSVPATQNYEYQNLRIPHPCTLAGYPKPQKSGNSVITKHFQTPNLSAKPTPSANTTRSSNPYP